jgi:Protein of unknown function (DUF1203)
MGMTDFMIHALPAGEADLSASAGRLTVADGPYPCRRCLRNAVPGEPLLLVSYDPFTTKSPYSGQGPIFVHADGCRPHGLAPGELSEQVLGRVLSVRGYDDHAMMRTSHLLAGEQLAERAGDLLLQQGNAFLHVHFAGPGCFAFRVDPA